MDATQQTSRPCRTCADEVVQRARALIEAQHHFVGRSQWFEFSYENDVLIVRGTVPTFYLKQIVQCVLKGLDGVRLIDNQVMVTAIEGLTRSREA